MLGRFGVFVLALIAGVSASPTWGQEVTSPGPVVSLRIVSRSQVPGESPGGVDMVYRLVNDSAKTIVAWEFACVTAKQDGNSVQGAIGYDGYVPFERSRTEDEPPFPEVIAPGMAYEQRIQVSPAELDGPMAGKTCGPVLVIFDDTTYEGTAAKAGSWFRSRARTAVDAWAGREALARELGSSRTLAETLETLNAKLSRPATDPKGTSVAGRLFSAHLNRLRQGLQTSAAEVLTELDFHYSAAMNHLPPSWRANVLEEVGQ